MPARGACDDARPFISSRNGGRMQRRTILGRLFVTAAGTALAASFAISPAHAADPTLKVGTMSGPDAQIWSVVTKVAAREGLNVKVIEFNDYVQPNAAL